MRFFQRLFRRTRSEGSDTNATTKVDGQAKCAGRPNEPQYPPEVIEVLLSDFFQGKTLLKEQQEIVDGQIEEICEQYDDLIEQYLSGEPFTASQKDRILQAARTRRKIISPPADFVSACLGVNFQEQAETRTSQADPAFQAVLTALNAGEYATVSREAEALVRKYPDYADLYYWWGKALVGRSALVEARQMLQEALPKVRKKFALCNLLGEIEWKSSSITEAVYWWAQAFHCQESLPNHGGDCGAYLYLHYVADALDMSDCAAVFLARSDQTRPGQIRLNPSAAGQLREVAHHSKGLGIESVLEGLRAKYLGTTQKKPSEAVDTGEFERLIAVVADMSAGYEVQVAAANRLGEIGNPRAIPALMEATRDLSLSVQDAAEKALRKIQG